jgi:type II secretory pathway pseudopilin PulG
MWIIVALAIASVLWLLLGPALLGSRTDHEIERRADETERSLTPDDYEDWGKL